VSSIVMPASVCIPPLNIGYRGRITKGAINATTGVQKCNIAKTITLSQGSLERSWGLAEDRLLFMALHSRDGGQVSL